MTKALKFPFILKISINFFIPVFLIKLFQSFLHRFKQLLPKCNKKKTFQQISVKSLIKESWRSLEMEIIIIQMVTIARISHFQHSFFREVSRRNLFHHQCLLPLAFNNSTAHSASFFVFFFLSFTSNCVNWISFELFMCLFYALRELSSDTFVHGNTHVRRLAMAGTE